MWLSLLIGIIGPLIGKVLAKIIENLLKKTAKTLGIDINSEKISNADMKRIVARAEYDTGRGKPILKRALNVLKENMAAISDEGDFDMKAFKQSLSGGDKTELKALGAHLPE